MGALQQHTYSEPEVVPIHTGETSKKKNIKSIGIQFSKPSLTKKDIQSVLECMVLDEISFGKVGRNFEKVLANSFEFDKALAVPSLTSGYHLALMGLEVEEGDEVILPSTAPVAVLDAIGYLNARAVLVDIDRDQFHSSVQQISEKVTDKTKAILLYYAFGAFYDYSELREKLESGIEVQQKDDQGNISTVKRTSKHIKIVEDISYLAGMEYNGRLVGNDADIAIIGLNKEMPMTIGKGATILTDNKRIYTIAKDLRMQADRRPYKIRYDYTIPDYQAAMGLEQIGQLTTMLERRRKIGYRFLEAVNFQPKTKTFFSNREVDSYGLFPVYFDKDQDAVLKYFQSLNIEVKKTMALGPLHQLNAENAIDFPNTERLYQKGILLPLYPNLTRLNVERIIAAVKGFY